MNDIVSFVSGIRVTYHAQEQDQECTLLQEPIEEDAT